MNFYIINYKDKVYATNADNMLDAENKFIEEFGEIDSKIEISQSKKLILEVMKKTIYF